MSNSRCAACPSYPVVLCTVLVRAWESKQRLTEHWLFVLQGQGNNGAYNQGQGNSGLGNQVGILACLLVFSMSKCSALPMRQRVPCMRLKQAW